jgi:outer membrane protein assembly factor BamA
LAHLCSQIPALKPFQLISRFFLLLFLFGALTSLAQDNPPKQYKGETIQIEAIEVKGNQKTVPEVIIREMAFQIGDSMSVPDFLILLDRSEQNIENMRLFMEVSVFLTSLSQGKAEITVYVRERLYHLPAPVFKLIDRNFNVWLQDYNLDFSRITYGLNYSVLNLRGRNQTLSLGFNLGFNQTLMASYNVPNIGSTNFGLNGYFKVDRTKQIGIETDEDKLQYLSGSDFIRTYTQAGLVLNYDQSLYNTHFVGLQYMHTRVGDTVLKENPQYLLSNGNKQDFFQFSYRFQRDLRDRIVYPTRGNFWSLEFEKLGLGIFNDVNFFNLYGNYIQYLDLGSNFYASSQLKFKTSAPFKQAYFNQQALGYRENLVRGYELYVVDGQHYGLMKLNLKYKLLSFRMQSRQFLNDARYEGLPFEFYLKAHFDAAYVKDDFHNQGNYLSNNFLVGGGFGLDMVLPYDLVLRLEYSACRFRDGENTYLENGLYLHFNIALQDFMNVTNRFYP